MKFEPSAAFEGHATISLAGAAVRFLGAAAWSAALSIGAGPAWAAEETACWAKPAMYYGHKSYMGVCCTKGEYENADKGERLCEIKKDRYQKISVGSYDVPVEVRQKACPGMSYVCGQNYSGKTMKIVKAKGRSPYTWQTAPELGAGPEDVTRGRGPDELRQP